MQIVKTNLILLLLNISSFAFAENHGDFNPNINKVENGLKYGVVIEGQKSINILDRMKTLNIPNASVAVINNGNIEWAKAYTLTGYTDISTHTLFQAGSISKPVAAFLMMKYIQNSDFSLYDNVNNYLSTWKLNENQYTEQYKVTLARILSHTAGLGVHGFIGYKSSTPLNYLPTLIQILNGENPPANSSKIEVIGYPGQQYSYSGGGYIVAQKMLEDITDRKFSDEIQESVLNPLNMTESTYNYYWPNDKHPSIAVAYNADGTPVEGGWHIYPESTAAGLWSTPTDLTKFIIEIQQSYEGKSNKVLFQDTVKEMLTQQPNSPHGLGPVITKYEDGITEFQHGGSNAGYEAYMVGFTKNGQGAVVMTNSDNGQSLCAEIIRSIADTYSWHNGYTYQYLSIKKIHPIDPSLTQKLVGNYYLTIDNLSQPMFVQITNEDNKAYFYFNNEKVELSAASSKIFFNQVNEIQIQYLDEKYSHFVLNYFGQKLNAIRN